MKELFGIVGAVICAFMILIGIAYDRPRIWFILGIAIVGGLISAIIQTSRKSK